MLNQALEDFKERIAKYEEVYETITDRNLHYIKLIDMCAHSHAHAMCTRPLHAVSMSCQCASRRPRCSTLLHHVQQIPRARFVY